MFAYDHSDIPSLKMILIAFPAPPHDTDTVCAALRGSNKSAINISPPTIKYTSSWGYCQLG